MVTAPVVIVEGNWLLLDDERWRTLMEYCDFSLFIRAPPKRYVRARWDVSWPADSLRPTPTRFMSAPTGQTWSVFCVTAVLPMWN